MNNSRALRISFYSLWLITLFIQAYLVELQGDEAYYWRYSEQLAWGYFDHPPVTALLVKAGYLLFRNELGVRFFFILLGAATIGVMEKMIQPSQLKLFYALVVSIAFLQIGMVFGGGMFAIPDFPLLFFTALFFYFYRRYLEESSGWLIVVLSIVIALLLLSKYHGVLVVGFTLLSNLSLLKKKSFWLVVGLSTLLLVPHIWWQVSHGFPSVNYHLFERSSKGYSFAYTANYLFSQPFVLGPFVGLLLIHAGVMFTPKDTFERSLKFMTIGTYLFFLLMTFKGSVEANWTIITCVPLLYVGYNFISQRERLKKLTFYSFAVSLPLILGVRIAVMGNFLPVSVSEKIFGNRRWTTELKEKSGNKPVAFMNSYQRASLYEFYTGVPAFSLNNVWGRKNQYTTWDTEATFQGKSITLVPNTPAPQYDSIRFLKEHLPYLTISNFRSSSNVLIASNLAKSVRTGPSEKIEVKVKFNLANNHGRDFEANPEFPSYLIYSFFQHTQSIEMQSPGIQLMNNMLNNDREYSIMVTAPEQKGTYDFYMSIGTGWLPPGINSEKIKFIVE